MDSDAAFTSSLPRLKARPGSRCTRVLFRLVGPPEDISQVSGNIDPLPRLGSRVICQQMPAYERVNEKIVLDALTLASLLRAGSVGECATARCVSRLHACRAPFMQVVNRAQPQC